MSDKWKRIIRITKMVLEVVAIVFTIILSVFSGGINDNKRYSEA